MLTTLSGVTFKVSLSVAKFDRFEDLEDQVVDYLASVTDLKVFGCSIDFLQTATQTYLKDPNLGQATARHGIHHCLQELQCLYCHLKNNLRVAPSIMFCWTFMSL